MICFEKEKLICNQKDIAVNKRFKKTGFSIVELLTVLAIITFLVGLLVPALNTVRTMARATKQKAQFGAQLAQSKNKRKRTP